MDEPSFDHSTFSRNRARLLQHEVWKDLVVLAPDNQRRRLAFAEVRLDPWVEWKIGSVVVEEIRLDVSIAWPIE
jgi:hypothetical protein